jgi:hypothetical protein
MGTTVPGSQGSIVSRMIGAAMLNANTYEEVEADTTATGQAAVVVVIVAICSAIGLIWLGGLRSILAGPIRALISWLVWSGVTFVVGTKVFGGTATWGEMLRTIGFAQSPGVLLVVGIIPVIGWLAYPIVAIWTLVAGVVAIRQALDFDTGKAILTAIVGFVVMLIVTALVLRPLGLAGMGRFY